MSAMEAGNVADRAHREFARMTECIVPVEPFEPPATCRQHARAASAGGTGLTRRSGGEVNGSECHVSIVGLRTS